LLRPQQWTKNAIVLAGVVFSGQALDPAQAGRAILTMLAFCLASSAIYIFNDWHDRDEDRRHPTKCRRPIASGAVSPSRALVISASLATVSLVLALNVSPAVAGIEFAYLVLMVVYTLVLRNEAIVDILAIAGGFLLRAWAGAVAVDVPLSGWLMTCTLILALLLGLGKRRHELRRLHFAVDDHRPSLQAYARINIDAWMVVAAVLTAGIYAGYTLSVPSFGRSLPMLLTLPFAIAGICRYMYLVFRRQLGGSPELLLLTDRPLLLSVALWSGTVAIVLAS
jgi:4-hydroxybenzoate polyprenyltransferase